MSSQESASRFRALYEQRLGIGPNEKHRSEIMVRTAKNAAEFRDVVLSKLGRLSPKWPRQIWGDVQDDYGSCSEHRIYRALVRLQQDGRVKRTDGGYLLVRRRTA